MAVDLDGTLVRRDGTICQSDLDALERLQQERVGVIVATGRFPVHGASIARRVTSLPVICADGALITRSDGSCQLARCLSPRELVWAHQLCEEHQLKPFALGHTACYFDPADAHLHGYVEGWCKGAPREPRRAMREVATVLGLGTEADVHTAATSRLALSPGRVALDTFQLAPSSMWALRFSLRGVSKAHAFARVARSLGVRREHWAAVGNDLNDLSLFRQVACAFAMSDAPDAVKASASLVLSASSDGGGALCEIASRLSETGLVDPSEAQRLVDSAVRRR